MLLFSGTKLIILAGLLLIQVQSPKIPNYTFICYKPELINRSYACNALVIS
jgi:hypothetical protein